MRAEHLEAERRYGELRRRALEMAQHGAPASLRYTAIDAAAQAAAENWRGAMDRRVNWDWNVGLKALKFRYPKRFEVALWHASELIAMSFGRPTYRGDYIRLDLIEARPDSLGARISVFPQVEAAYEVYARLLNAKEIRIMNPINDEVKTHYRSMGYEYVSRHDYLYREVL